jgi:hypothetical protein
MQLFDSTLSPAVAEAKLLHPEDSGYFTVGSKSAGGKWKEAHFHMSKLAEVSQSLRGQADTYMSQSSFASPARGSFNTKSLRCVYVDLDTYNMKGLEGADSAKMTELVIARARELGVPDPSYIASSGCGYYAKWVFENSIQASLMPQWKVLQKKLVSAFLPMGADSKVTDPARVLRLQETINSKNLAEVQLIHEGQAHSFTDLFRSTAHLEVLKRNKLGEIVKASDIVQRRGIRLNPEDLISDAALTDLDGLVMYSEKRNPAMLQQMSGQSLNWSRFLDLRDLVIARGGIRKGSRDMTLFWMVNFLSQAGVIDPSNFWNEVKSLLASFPTGRDFNPLADGSLSTLLARIQAQSRGEKIILEGVAYDPIYTPKNDTLLNILQVTPEEERDLRTIISSSEKLRRADEKVPGRADRRVEREEMRLVAVSLSEQGVSQTEIARQLGKNKSTVSRWLAPDERVGRPYVETRGRRKEVQMITAPGGIWTKLTGRGAVIVGGPNLSGNSSQADRKPGHLSEVDLKRRMRVRQERAHLRSGACRWNPEQITS